MKIHLRPFLCLVFLLTAVPVLTGESSPPEEQEPVYTLYPTALGVSANIWGDGGAGLHYHHTAGRWAWEGDVGLWYYPDESGYEYSSTGEPVLQDIGSYNLQFTLLYRVYEDAFADWFSGALYLFTAVQHTGYLERDVEYGANPSENPLFDWDDFVSTADEIRYAPSVGLGFGIGLEPVLFRHISLPLEFGLGGTWILGEPLPDFAGMFTKIGLRYRY